MRGEGDAGEGGGHVRTSPFAASRFSRTLRATSLWVASLWATLAWGAAPPPYEFYDRLRGDVPLDVEPRPAPIAPVENRDLRRGRSWASQPPTIPHKIDNYQLDRYANRCMTCHARTRAAESQAPAVSTSHYQDREGRFLADLAPRRYFCTQCHVVQVDVKPPVDNTFQDVETLIQRDQQAPRKGGRR